jgi:hypothetical protein
MSIKLLFCILFTSTVNGSIYNIVPRRVSDEPRSPSASPQLISFDGDLDYIRDAALARAGDALTPTASPSIVNLPSTGTEDNGGAIVLDEFTCKGANIEHLEILTFLYSIETAPNANITQVIGEVEEILMEEIAPFTLSCRNITNKFANIVAMDCVVPADTPSKDGKFP